MENKWRQFESPDYELVDLGRPAIFLIPVIKLQTDAGKKAEEYLCRFLLAHFEAYTVSQFTGFGVWRNAHKTIVHDQCKIYEVSFVGPERIPMLLKKLASVAKEIKEECLYFKAGQYSCLVYPPRKR